MTLTEIALMSPRLASVSRISCCWAGSPDGGLRKATSTPTSPAAFLHPASTIDQNGSGLLLTKATLGLPAAEQPIRPKSNEKETRQRCKRGMANPHEASSRRHPPI